jgi:hypothetical protein
MGSLSYLVNVLLAAGWFGTFFAARNKARKADNDALGAEALGTAMTLVKAQKESLEFLEHQNDDQQKLIDELLGRVEYLEGLVLRGTKLVEPGSVPDLRGGRRTRPPGHPKSGNDGSVR